MALSQIDISGIPEKYTMAKTTRESAALWLPFWMHSLDTEAVMAYLLRNWVSGAVKTELRALVNGTMTAEESSRLGRFLALMHDLGKVTSEFQNIISRNAPEIKDRMVCAGLSFPLLVRKATPHAVLSQRILLRGHEREKGLLTAACVIGAHHGKPTEHADSGAPPYDPDGSWQPIQEAWIAFALQQSGYESLSELPCMSQAAQVLWTGLLIMSDWIASNPYYFPLISMDEDGSQIDYGRRKITAFHKLHLTQAWLPEEVWDYDQLYRNRFGFMPNDVQCMVSEAVASMEHPGIMILEAQMGVGKTEAALAAAEIIAGKTMHSGVYFGLPTQATANGIFGRLKDWTLQQASRECHSIRLAHGAAELNEEYQTLLEGQAEIKSDEEDNAGGVIVHEWFSGRKQALLADFVIGTVDQLLMAGLKQKHVMLRHLGLANKIVIVDECHAYDAYMNRYLEAVLHWLGAYHVPVILLSATLPAARRRDLILAYQNKEPRRQKQEPWMESQAYPLLTWTDGDAVCQKSIPLPRTQKVVTWAAAPWAQDDFQSLAEDLSQKLRAGGCVGVILNTVKRAQACAEAFRQVFDRDEVRVIHAQYLMPDRAKKEKSLVEELGKKSVRGAGRPERLIVVGTQVLEQSLDIDFDYLITDLCPMDLLLQRIGRLHRHNGRVRPEVFEYPCCKILCSAEDELEGGAAAIYGSYLLLRTRIILQQHGPISLPRDISPLVQQTYDENWDPPKADKQYQQAKCDDMKHKKDQQQRANTFCIDEPDDDEDEPGYYDWLSMSYPDSKGTAAVRDGDPSLDVLCMRWGPEDRLYCLEDTDFQKPFSPQNMPSEEEARLIARQKLRLPHCLCAKWNIEQTIAQLDQETDSSVREWLYSGWLHGEQFLLFDKDANARIGAFKLHYSGENGLELEKEEL